MSKFDDAFKRLKDNLKVPASKIEGTFSIFNLRSVAQESALLSNKMEIMENNWSLDTAQGAYLDAKVRDIGLFRHLAGYAYGICKFTGSNETKIPINTVVIAPEYGVQFATSKEAVIQNGYAEVETVATIPGAAANVPIGAISQILKPIKGINSVTNAKAFEHGTERESDNNLRLRAYFAIRNPRTSGNANDYKAWALDVEDVGKAKVFPLWDGPGTVKVSVIDSEGLPASEELITRVTNYIDPEQGMGGGKAPVGARVTIDTAKAKIINIQAKVEVGTTNTIEAITNAFKTEITSLFKDVAYDDKTNNISPAKIGYRLLEVPGVIDYTKLTLNGIDGSVSIGDQEVPVLGTVNLIQAP